MACSRRDFVALASSGVMATLAGCTRAQHDNPASPNEPAAPEVDVSKFASLAFNQEAWHFDEVQQIWYQLEVTYCTNPATKAHESLALFVPGAYLTGTKNSDGSTYTCTINEKAVVGSFTPATAPVVFPINTGTLAAQASPTTYDALGLDTYLNAGCVYVYAGFRGRSAAFDTSAGGNGLIAGGSPWPVAGLKAAIRYMRYNDAVLPCDTTRAFVMGFSLGGGMAAVLGASGDSEVFTPYLEELGAATHNAQGAVLSDAVAGVATWCPQTSLGVADGAYEWASGQFSNDATRAENTVGREMSAGLVPAYAGWINGMDLRNESDEALRLDDAGDGSWHEGSYADYLVRVLDDAASQFVASTEFPYTAAATHITDPTFPGDPNIADARQVALATGGASGVGAGASAGVTQVQATVYDSLQSYVASLNGEGSWLTLDGRKQTASVKSLSAFVRAVRPSTLGCVAFDALDRSSLVNQLFGTGQKSTLHFSTMVRDVAVARNDRLAALEGWNANLLSDYEVDLISSDTELQRTPKRVAAFDPLTWLSGLGEEFGKSTVAGFWRVNEGLFDTEVPLPTATNLALALWHCPGVIRLDHIAVWGQGHVMAERSGSAVENFINWVVDCYAVTG